MENHITNDFISHVSSFFPDRKPGKRGITKRIFLIKDNPMYKNKNPSELEKWKRDLKIKVPSLNYNAQKVLTLSLYCF